MQDYRGLYDTLFQAITSAIQSLQKAQQQTEQR